MRGAHLKVDPFMYDGSITPAVFKDFMWSAHVSTTCLKYLNSLSAHLCHLQPPGGIKTKINFTRRSHNLKEGFHAKLTKS